MDRQSLHELALQAVRCNACFLQDGALRRSFVDLPQPRYVGPDYAESEPRIAWLMINPGAGQPDQANRSWRAVLLNYQHGRAGLDDVFREQRRHMPAWNDLIPFVAKHGLSVDRLALVNVAWCATAGNSYPRHMLRRCWDAHTARWLAAVKPDVVILSGTAAHAFDADLAALLPSARRIRTFHYAHRPPDAARADARAIEVKRELGL